MATKLFLRNTQLAKPAVDLGVIGVDDIYDMLTTAGASADTGVVNTAASGTEILLTKTAGGSTIAWISGRTPSGGFTLTTTDVDQWWRESNMNANCGGRYRVFRYRPGAPATLTELGGGPFNDGVEFGTADASMTWAGNVTDLAFSEDDRIVIKVYITNVGTMASGHTCTMTFNAADASNGDSFLNIAETVTFKAESQTISGAGNIATAEAFGTTTLNMRIQGAAGAIASGEAFGVPKLNLLLFPGGIASAEAFGTALLRLYIAPAGITTGEAFGSPSVTFGAAQTIVGAGNIASAEAFGTTKLNQQIIASAIASAEAFGAALLRLYVGATGIASAEAFGSPEIRNVTRILPSAIASAEAFGTAQLNLRLALTGIASAEGFGTPRLILYLRPSGVASAEAFGSADVRNVTRILPSGIASAEVFGTATLNQILRAISIASAESFGAPFMVFDLFIVPGIARATAISMTGPAGSSISMVPPGGASVSMSGPTATNIGTE